MILPWVLSILSTASGPIARGSGPTTRGLVGGCSPALGWLPGALGTLGAFLWLLGRLAIGLMPSLTGARRPVLAWEAAEWVPLAAEERGVPAGRLLAWVERELGC